MYNNFQGSCYKEFKILLSTKESSNCSAKADFCLRKVCIVICDF